MKNQRVTIVSVLGFALLVAVVAGLVARGAGGEPMPVYIDLTDPIPTFEPFAERPWEPDLDKPLGDSQPVPSFFRQAVLATSVNSTGEQQGHFYRAYLTIAEHHGTHIDVPSHDINAEETAEGSALPAKFQHDLERQREGSGARERSRTARQFCSSYDNDD